MREEKYYSLTSIRSVIESEPMMTGDAKKLLLMRFMRARPAKVYPPVRSEWKRIGEPRNFFDFSEFQCLNCKQSSYATSPSEYCSHCGAKMNTKMFYADGEIHEDENNRYVIDDPPFSCPV